MMASVEAASPDAATSRVREALDALPEDEVAVRPAEPGL